jgi:threonine dehydrogenase-like Zn-dependent dehydrogenase
MIAAALGAIPIAIDIDNGKLDFAKSIGAAFTINAKETPQVSDAVISLTKGGADVSVDALGSRETCINSIRSLRKQGKHIQLGTNGGFGIKSPITHGRNNCKRTAVDRQSWYAGPSISQNDGMDKFWKNEAGEIIRENNNPGRKLPGTY